MSYKLLICLLISLVVMPMPSHGVDIQYLLSGGRVTGVSDSSIPNVPDHGVVTITGTSNQIVWPVPGGCTIGRPEWSRITDPDNVTLAGGGMAVRTGLVFFSTSSNLMTGCRLVSSWIQLRTLVEQTIATAVQAQDLVLALNDINVFVSVRCPASNVTQNCIDARANMVTLNAGYPSAAAAKSFTDNVVDLIADAQAVKSAQGW